MLFAQESSAASGQASVRVAVIQVNYTTMNLKNSPQ